MKRNMRNFREILFKILVIGGLSLGLSILPICICYEIFDWNENIGDVIIHVMLFSSIGAGMAVFFMLVFGAVPSAPSKMKKVEKIACLFRNFEDLQGTLAACLQGEYVYHNSVWVGEKHFIELYARREPYNKIKCVIITYVPELSTTFLEQGNDIAQKFLEDFCGTSRIVDRIVMTSFFCVDRVNSVFYDMVNKDELLDYKVRYLPIGISFGGKKIYIANPKCHSLWYKAAREEVFQLLGSVKDGTDTTPA